MADALLRYMQKHGIEQSREKYIALAYGSDYGALGAEEEAELPDELRVTSLNDYNPNRHPAGAPDSKGGEFAPKESGTSSISMEPDPDRTAEIIFNELVPKELQERMAKDIAIAKAMPETYLDNSPQRLLMREKIAEKLYNKDIDKRVQGREATIILGLPGAGKSTLANPMLDNGAIEIDPDIAKGEIPEFNGGIGANAVHEESSAINKEVLKRAVANGDNIVWPRINGKDKLKRDVEMLQKNGYKVKVQIINVTPETAIRSAVDRYVKSGRLVSPSTILEYGNTPMETYEAASEIPGVTVEKYKRDHGKGVEPDHTKDYNPYHDPETGQFTTAGWFTGGTIIKRKGRKTSPRQHRVFAEHPDDVPNILINNRKATALKTDEVLLHGEIKQVAGDTRTHRQKLPNKGSKEYEFLQEMQARVDEQSGGYKGD